MKHPGTPMSYMSVIKQLKIRDAKSKAITKGTLFSLEASGFLRKLSSNKFVLDVELDEVRGKVDHVNPRFAYVTVDGRQDDIWVRSDDLNFAVDGDEVLVEITRESSKNYRAEGRVTRIVNRARTEYVGRIEISDKFAFVIPDNRNIHFDVFLYPEKAGKAKHNDKVIVKIAKWHDRANKSPLGEVTEVLGPAGENEAEIHSIMAEFGLPFHFPKTVEQAAKKIPTEITKEEIKKRWDFRDVTTFTIDPHDAKDFDDALSIRKVDGELWEVGCAHCRCFTLRRARQCLG